MAAAYLGRGIARRETLQPDFRFIVGTPEGGSPCPCLLAGARGICDYRLSRALTMPPFQRYRLATLFASLCVAATPTSRAETRSITPSECLAMKAKNVISEKSPIGCNRLKRVSFRYVNFDGETRMGEVAVLDAVSRRTQIIFDSLYSIGFPLNKAALLEDYLGDDDASMNDNNTSAFSARAIAGSQEWSLHAFGVAIDVNPFQNPFIYFDNETSVAHIIPASSSRISVNRQNYRPNKDFRPGMAEEVIDIFAYNGFLNWGGYWNFPIDYQHFEVGNRDFVMRLAKASPSDAEQLFEEYIHRYVSCVTQLTPKQAREAARAACVSRMTQ